VNPSNHGTGIGADVGASLAKVAIRRGEEPLRLELAPTQAIERVAREVESLRPRRTGVTGGGGARFADLLTLDTTRIGEFEAWATGARELLRMQGETFPEPFLLVSLGTGTSVLLVDRDRVERVGGTALGGGTILGLGKALTGRGGFDELVALASQGDRRRIDLLVSDVYPDGLAQIPGAASAASFGKLAGEAGSGGRSDPRDLASALLALVGESVALLCNALAGQAGVSRIVFGGSTLRGNAPLSQLLVAFTTAFGREPIVLAGGEYSGAIGALLLAG
jgi:type II pantothenate kinase